MQQRRPRLGDIVDDYCPRERRITNHAIVAMIDDEVKQTRCTTCDADHEYKHAKVPAQRRKKDELPALLGDAPGVAPRKRPALEQPSEAPNIEAQTRRDADADADTDTDTDTTGGVTPEPVPASASAAPADTNASSADFDESAEPSAPGEDEGPVHRRLIRATLPRPEGQVPERKLPEFTVRQPGHRGRFEADGNSNGHRQGGRRPTQGGGQGPSRFARSGSSHGQGARHGSGPGGQRPGQQGRHGSGPGQRQNAGPRHGQGSGQGPRQGSGQGQPGQPRRNRKRGR
jgi:hypothetical protein